ncbi:MAG: hypothetical protein WEF53_04020 [Bacteroidota bacterium]
MTDNKKTFIHADDETLIMLIGNARQRLVFIAPGVRKTVAQALASSMDVVPVEAIHLVVDADPEVCRLGYGSLNGLELLQFAAGQHNLVLNNHPGIRIGLLIADEATLIYSPTPLLIEGGSQTPNKPNAVILDAQLPQALADACAAGERQGAKLEVGRDVVDAGKLDAVKRDLLERPPKKFNVARVERVFNSMLHYVELRIEDYKLTSRSLALDAKLFGVTNPEVVRRLRNRYTLFADTESLNVEIESLDADGKANPKKTKEKFGPRSIDEERQRIKKRFILEAGDYGLIILRKDVEEFEKQINALRSKIEAYKKAVQTEIARRTDEIVIELLAALKDALKANPPEHWRSRYMGETPADADIERLFQEEIRAEVKRVNTDFNPRVFHAFKDVTYKTFKDEKFRKLLEVRFGKDAIDRIFSEHDAAPEE